VAPCRGWSNDQVALNRLEGETWVRESDFEDLLP